MRAFLITALAAAGIFGCTQAFAEDPMRTACANAQYASDHYSVCETLAEQPDQSSAVSVPIAPPSSAPIPSAHIVINVGNHLTAFPFWGTMTACTARVNEVVERLKTMDSTIYGGLCVPTS